MDDQRELEGRSRDELIALAEGLGVARAATLTQPELVDEILLASAAARGERPPPRGFFGRARDLLKSVIDRGLHLPETAAKVLRPSSPPPSGRAPKPPVATLTLAEIYAAQGHTSRAIGVLDEVLARQPDHTEARALRDKLAGTTAPAEAAGRKATAAPRAGRGAAVGSEGEAALPDAYDVDEVVAIAVDPVTLYLYWEIRPTTFAEARAAHPAGHLLLRIVSVNPGTASGTRDLRGPFADQRDIPIDGLLGEMFVRNLTPASNVRVSIGWHHEGVFEPLAIGLELATPRVLPGDLGHGIPPLPADPIAERGVSRRLEEMLGKEGKRLVAMTIPSASTRVRAIAPSGHDDPRFARDDEPSPPTEVLWVVDVPGSSDLSRRRSLHRGASELSRGGASELGRLRA